MNNEPKETYPGPGKETTQIATYDDYLRRKQEIANERFEKLSPEEQVPIQEIAERLKSGSVNYTDSEALQAAIDCYISVPYEEIGVTPERVDELIAEFEKDIEEA